MGNPHSWMVYFMENPMEVWMIYNGNLISGNPPNMDLRFKIFKLYNPHLTGDLHLFLPLSPEFALHRLRPPSALEPGPPVAPTHRSRTSPAANSTNVGMSQCHWHHKKLMVNIPPI